jgi:hypothetical protein
LRVDSDVRDLDAGRPLRATGCRRLPIAAGPQRIEIPAATLRPDSVMLTSPAPSPIARPVPRLTAYRSRLTAYNRNHFFPAASTLAGAAVFPPNDRDKNASNRE